MLATAGALPKADDAFGYEMKWDGVRVMLYASGSKVWARSRSDRDVTPIYPELQGLGPASGARAFVLDGEVVAADEAGRISFGALQPRMHVTQPGLALLQRIPVTYLVFDLLHLDETSTLDLPYTARRELLTALGLGGPHWRTPPSFAGNGEQALATSRAQGLEGIVAKRLDSRYHPGRRSRDWVKVKNLRTQEVVIGGWRPGQGRREGGIGSLLLGVPAPAGLLYVGHVGTGFTDAMLDDMAARLAPDQRPDSPFCTPLPRPHAKDAHWVTPKLVGEVVYAERTGDGMLRHPAWRGLRPDKSPADVILEP
ncbi:MAG TPA: non-homologous end-joining DNA ligase [Cryptosporangiaceae bacterium]|nr:non-homologous end-joining DNA ligase [Cryptosporangiaceae bacterium]